MTKTAVVAASETTIATIIGPLNREVAKAAHTPTRPATHSGPKSVRASGKIRAPSDATGRSIMHFRTNLGILRRNEEAKYGMIRGRSVTAEHVRIRTILFKTGLLVRIDGSSEQSREDKGNKEGDTCPKSHGKYQDSIAES